MSASTTPTDSPRAAIAAARLTVTDDLPTPPLPEATQYTRVSDPGRANGTTGSAASPRRLRRNAVRCSSLITSSSTCTPRRVETRDHHVDIPIEIGEHLPRQPQHLRSLIQTPEEQPELHDGSHRVQPELERGDYT